MHENLSCHILCIYFYHILSFQDILHSIILNISYFYGYPPLQPSPEATLFSSLFSQYWDLRLRKTQRGRFISKDPCSSWNLTKKGNSRSISSGQIYSQLFSTKKIQGMLGKYLLAMLFGFFILLYMCNIMSYIDAIQMLGVIATSILRFNYGLWPLLLCEAIYLDSYVVSRYWGGVTNGRTMAPTWGRFIFEKPIWLPAA